MSKFKDIKNKGDVAIQKVDDDEFEFIFNQYDGSTGNLLPGSMIKTVSRQELLDQRERVLFDQQESLERWAAELADIDDMLVEIDSIG